MILERTHFAMCCLHFKWRLLLRGCLEATHFLAALLALHALSCRAQQAYSVSAPSGSWSGPTVTSTIYPFFTEQGTIYTNFSTMRYQQVYNRSLFTNLATNLIYVTSIAFYS